MNLNTQKIAYDVINNIWFRVTVSLWLYFQVFIRIIQSINYFTANHFSSINTGEVDAIKNIIQFDLFSTITAAIFLIALIVIPYIIIKKKVAWFTLIALLYFLIAAYHILSSFLHTPFFYYYATENTLPSLNQFLAWGIIDLLDKTLIVISISILLGFLFIKYPKDTIAQ